MSGSENSNSSSPRYCPTPHQMPVPTGSPHQMPVPTGSPHQMPVPTGSPHQMPVPTGSPHQMPVPTGSPPPNAMMHQVMPGHGHGHNHHMQAQHSQSMGYYGYHNTATHQQNYYAPQSPNTSYYGMQHPHPSHSPAPQYVQQQATQWQTHVHQQGYYNHGYPAQSQQNSYAPQHNSHHQQIPVTVAGGNATTYEMGLTHNLAPPSNHSIAQSHQHVVSNSENSGQHALMNLSRFVTQNQQPNPSHGTSTATVNNTPTISSSISNVSLSSNSNGSSSSPRPEPIRSPVVSVFPPNQATSAVPVPLPSASTTNGGQTGMMPVRLQNMAKGARTKASMRKMMLEQQSSANSSVENHDSVLEEPPKKRMRRKPRSKESVDDVTDNASPLAEEPISKKPRKPRTPKGKVEEAKIAEQVEPSPPPSPAKKSTVKNLRRSNSKSPAQTPAPSSVVKRVYSPDVTEMGERGKINTTMTQKKKRGRKPKSQISEKPELKSSNNVEEEIAHVLLDLQTGKSSPEKSKEEASTSTLNERDSSIIMEDSVVKKRKRKSPVKPAEIYTPQLELKEKEPTSGKRRNKKVSKSKKITKVEKLKTTPARRWNSRKSLTSITDDSGTLGSIVQAVTSPKRKRSNRNTPKSESFPTSSDAKAELNAFPAGTHELMLNSLNDFGEQEFPVIHIPETASESSIVVKAKVEIPRLSETALKSKPVPVPKSKSKSDSLLNSETDLDSKPPTDSYSKSKSDSSLKFKSDDTALLISDSESNLKSDNCLNSMQGLFVKPAPEIPKPASELKMVTDPIPEHSVNELITDTNIETPIQPIEKHLQKPTFKVESPSVTKAQSMPKQKVETPPKPKEGVSRTKSEVLSKSKEGISPKTKSEPPSKLKEGNSPKKTKSEPLSKPKEGNSPKKTKSEPLSKHKEGNSPKTKTEPPSKLKEGLSSKLKSVAPSKPKDEPAKLKSEVPSNPKEGPSKLKSEAPSKLKEGPSKSKSEAQKPKEKSSLKSKADTPPQLKIETPLKSKTDTAVESPKDNIAPKTKSRRLSKEKAVNNAKIGSPIKPKIETPRAKKERKKSEKKKDPLEKSVKPNTSKVTRKYEDGVETCDNADDTKVAGAVPKTVVESTLDFPVLSIPDDLSPATATVSISTPQVQDTKVPLSKPKRSYKSKKNAVVKPAVTSFPKKTGRASKRQELDTSKESIVSLEPTIILDSVEVQDFPVMSIAENDSTITITAATVINSALPETKAKKTRRSSPKVSRSPRQKIDVTEDVNNQLSGGIVTKKSRSRKKLSSTDSPGPNPKEIKNTLPLDLEKPEMSMSDKTPLNVTSSTEIEDISVSKKTTPKKGSPSLKSPKTTLTLKKPPKLKKSRLSNASETSALLQDNANITLKSDSEASTVVQSSRRRLSRSPSITIVEPEPSQRASKKRERSVDITQVAPSPPKKRKNSKTLSRNAVDDTIESVAKVPQEINVLKITSSHPTKKRVSMADRARLDVKENDTIVSVSKAFDKPLPPLEFFYQFEYSQRNNYPPSLPSPAKRKHAILEARKHDIMNELSLLNDGEALETEALANSPKSETLPDIEILEPEPARNPTTSISSLEENREPKSVEKASTSKPLIDFIPALAKPLKKPSVFVKSMPLASANTQSKAEVKLNDLEICVMEKPQDKKKNKTDNKTTQENKGKHEKRTSHVGPSLRVKGGVVKFYRGSDEEDVDVPVSKLRAERTTETYDSTVPWICSFCRLGPHSQRLGDLFGPYYINTTEDLLEDITPGGSSNLKTISKYGAQSVQKKETWMHQDCALWAGGVVLVGTSIRGLDKAVYDSNSISCTICKEKGAMIGCLWRGCDRAAHFPCAQRSNWNLDEDTFHSYCEIHSKF